MVSREERPVVHVEKLRMTSEEKEKTFESQAIFHFVEIRRL